MLPRLSLTSLWQSSKPDSPLIWLLAIYYYLYSGISIKGCPCSTTVLQFPWCHSHLNNKSKLLNHSTLKLVNSYTIGISAKFFLPKQTHFMYIDTMLWYRPSSWCFIFRIAAMWMQAGSGSIYRFKARIRCGYGREFFYGWIWWLLGVGYLPWSDV